MSIEQFIDNEVKANDVVLFMKGTPQFPQCGFSGQVVQILDHIGVGYKGLNVLESAELRDGRRQDHKRIPVAGKACDPCGRTDLVWRQPR